MALTGWRAISNSAHVACGRLVLSLPWLLPPVPAARCSRRRKLQFGNRCEFLEPRELLSGTALTAHVCTASPTVAAANDVPLAVTNLGDSVVAETEYYRPTIVTDTAQIQGSLANFSNGQLRVALSNKVPQDQLTIVNSDRVREWGQSVYVDDVLVGYSSHGNLGSTLSVSFNDQASLETVQLVLRQIAFITYEISPSLAPRTFKCLVIDGDGTKSEVASKQILINDVPVALTLTSWQSFTVGGLPAPIGGSVYFRDGGGNYPHSSLSVNFTNYQAGDSLVIRFGARITRDANRFLVDGVPVGKFSGGSQNVPLVLTFNAQATLESVRLVRSSIAYANSKLAPSLVPRIVEFTMTDGHGLRSNPATVQVRLRSNIDVQGTPPEVPYSPGGPPVRMAASANLLGAGVYYPGSVLYFQVRNGVWTDRMAIRPGQGVTVNGQEVSYRGVVIGTFSGGNGQQALGIAFNDQATKQAATAVLRQVEYLSLNQQPFPTQPRRMHIFLRDSTSAFTAGTDVLITINDVTALTDIPADINYTPGQGAILVAPAGKIWDTGANFNSSVLTVQLANGSPGDRLFIRNQGGVVTSGNEIRWFGWLVGTFSGGENGAPLVLNFSATAAWLPAVQAVLRRIVFRSTSKTAPPVDPVLQLQFTDGLGHSSVVASQTIHFVST